MRSPGPARYGLVAIRLSEIYYGAMFTYLDPEIRRQLVDAGKLKRIDHQGATLDPDAQPPEGTQAINILGPIPLPLSLGDLEVTVQWYATVRSTELSKVENLARELRVQGGQHLFYALASSMAVNSVLVVGDPGTHDNPLVRVHSSCLTGDVFGSMRCECGPQLAGAIARIDVPADLVPKLETAGAAQRPFVLAEGGIWYDAVDVLSRRIAAAPGDAGLRGQRAALLEQVGLEEVAHAERAIAAGEPGSAAPAGRTPAGLSSDAQQR